MTTPDTAVPSFPREPIMQVEWAEASSLRGNLWNPNRVMTPELRLLERSILSMGWVQPVIASPDGVIIDGFHRWRLSQDSPQIRARYQGRLPVVRMDVDEPTAMAITVRINRAKGVHSARHMAALATTIVETHGWTKDRLAAEIGATVDEVELLLQSDVFAQKNIDKHAYSPAWYPAPNPAHPDNQTTVTAP